MARQLRIGREGGWYHAGSRSVERREGESWDDVRDRHGDWGRDLAFYLGRKECGMRLNELGAAVGGVDYAAVSAAVKRFERRTKREKKMAGLVKRGKQLLKVETRLQ